MFGLTTVIAMEVLAEDIRVSCIAPGIIQTKFSEALTDNDYIADRELENGGRQAH